jgi:hypothetical protein
MPFVLPDSGNATGTRFGVTTLIGSLGASFNPSNNTTILGADIFADPPFGLIGTDVSAHFPCGRPPLSASRLDIFVIGSAMTLRAAAWALGGFSQAYADVSITILEWSGRPPRGPKEAPKPARLLRTISFNPTTIVNFVGPSIGVQTTINDGAPFIATASVPVSRKRIYTFIVTVSQTATCAGVAWAVSNVSYVFPPPFFAFV